MTPFKRANSPYYYIRPTVPGYGRLGPWSTGTTNKARAQGMEAMIRELAMTGRGDLIRLIRAGKVRLPAVWVAKLEGRLDELLLEATQTRIEDAAAELRAITPDPNVEKGLRDLVRLIPAGARMGWLTSKHVEELLHAREAEGVKRNTVRRSLYTAISILLARELGEAKRAAIMQGVRYPVVPDERQVQLTEEDIARLLDSCLDPLFRELVHFALTSGVDRGPILRIQPAHFDEATGSLRVMDTKTAARPRVIELGDSATAALRRAMLLSHPGPRDRVFPFSPSQVHRRWEATRERAGLPWLRFKDLRAVFATYFLLAGGSPRQLQHILGHSNISTTLRYVKRLPVGEGRDMDAAAELMGVFRHLRARDAS